MSVRATVQKTDDPNVCIYSEEGREPISMVRLPEPPLCLKRRVLNWLTGRRTQWDNANTSERVLNPKNLFRRYIWD
jgi:hypothetical protein